MTQRANLHQLQRTSIAHSTFYEQYTQLEKNSAHQREPVRSAGDLPMTGNRDGSQCLVLDEGTVYYWNDGLQKWQSVLGKAYEISSNMRRFKRKYIAEEGQTVFHLDFIYEVGADALDVYVQGMLQDVNQDYEETDDRTITFRNPLPKDIIVTVATPMVIEGTYGVREIEKRLKELEHNNYQMIMSQYYSGKPVEVRGILFDGFLDTKYVDFMMTSLNMKYDNILKTMRLDGESIVMLYETFDNNTLIDPTSEVLLKNSEITLPIETIYKEVFKDDFSTRRYINEEMTNAYHDLEKQLITTVDTFAGANHYYKGDFMGTTGNADLVGYSGSIDVRAVYYRDGYYDWADLRWRSAYPQYLYSIIPSDIYLWGAYSDTVLGRPKFPYNGYYYMSKSETYRNGLESPYVGSSSTYTNRSLPLAESFSGSNYKTQMVYVKSASAIYALNQYSEGSDKYYQKLITAKLSGSIIEDMSSMPVPNNRPPTIFGTDRQNYSGSIDYISQIAATEKEVLFHTKDKVYFLDVATNTITKTLDWSTAEIKPPIYNSTAKQFAADARYLYFPSNESRNGTKGYYVYVFDINTGAFVNEILVSTTAPVSTAMHFDFHTSRLILGTNVGPTNLYGKSVNNYNAGTSYSTFIVFDTPNVNERIVQSKPITTNLPVINYRLRATQTLNDGLITYYIRIGGGAWIKIDKDKENTYVNPNGAKETTLELRAVLRTTSKSTTSPILTDWTLEVMPFKTTGIYKSITKQMSLKDGTGGRLLTTESIPVTSSLQWSLQVQKDMPEITFSSSREFTIPDNVFEGNVTLFARLGTNNVLMSPVVQDAQLQLHRVDAGILESTIFEQTDDVKNVTMWVTSGSSNDYYKAHLSRDGGKTWELGKRVNAVKGSDGNVETEWKFDMKIDTSEKRKVKIKLEMNGVTEIHQYGAVISPSKE